MKMHAYKIEMEAGGQIAELLQYITGFNLEDRRFLYPEHGIRVEATQIAGEFLLVDFVKSRRGHGPGRMADTRPLEEFDLADDEHFGEDTGFAVHIPTGLACLQYNHWGPRLSLIEAYMSAADQRHRHDSSGVTFAAILTHDAYARFRRMQNIRSFEVSIANPGVGRRDVDAGASLGRVLDNPFPEGAETIKIGLSAGRGNQHGINPPDVREFFDRLFGQHRDAVRVARVSGKAEDDSPVEPVDLLQEHLSGESTLEIEAGGRFSRAARWTALSTQLETWVREGAGRA